MVRVGVDTAGLVVVPRETLPPEAGLVVDLVVLVAGRVTEPRFVLTPEPSRTVVRVPVRDELIVPSVLVLVVVPRVMRPFSVRTPDEDLVEAARAERPVKMRPFPSLATVELRTRDALPTRLL